MGVVASFNYSAWQTRFPELAQTPPGLASAYFTEATIYWRNDGTGPVCDPNIQLTILNLLTAHIAYLYTQQQGDPSPGAPRDANTPPGRVSDASEGSVSGSFEYPSPDNASAVRIWANQTRYGAQWWSMTNAYRSFRYFAGPNRNPAAAGLGPFRLR